MPVPCELRSTGPQDRCKSARGPDADLRRNILIYFISEGSRFGADSQLVLSASQWALTAPPTPSEAPPLAQAQDDYLRVAPVFRCAPRPTASDAVAWRATHRRARTKKARNGSSCRRWNCRHFSALFHRKDKDLAGINSIWISNLVMVRFVNDCVSHARAVGDTADAPEAVPTGYDRGRDLGHDHGGR